MATVSISNLLEAWRDAERRWERRSTTDDVRSAAIVVIEAYVAYQSATLPTGEFILVTDNDHVYVAATAGVADVLGYAPPDLVGMNLHDIAAPDMQDAAEARWTQFLVEGRQDGRFQLRSRDGGPVWLHYQARAHHPVAGFHVSRLWLDRVAGAIRAEN